MHTSHKVFLYFNFNFLLWKHFALKDFNISTTHLISVQIAEVLRESITKETKG